MFGKIKIRPADTLFTGFVRARDKGICQWCGVEITNKYNSGVSHYWGRRKESTRFDPENADLMHNIPCHQEAEHEKKIKGIRGATEDGKYTIFMKKKLGDDGFNKLLIRSNVTGTKDDAMTKLYIKELMKEVS